MKFERIGKGGNVKAIDICITDLLRDHLKEIFDKGTIDSDRINMSKFQGKHFSRLEKKIRIWSKSKYNGRLKVDLLNIESLVRTVFIFNNEVFDSMTILSMCKFIIDSGYKIVKRTDEKVLSFNKWNRNGKGPEFQLDDLKTYKYQTKGGTI